MPAPQDTPKLDDHLWRGGERMNIVQVPDRFTVRLKRGVTSEVVERSYGAAHRHRLRRQNMDEFSVDADERDAVMSRVRSGADVEFASHVYAPANEPEARLYLTDQITVQFRPEVSDGEIERLMTEHGLLPLKDLAGVPRAFVFRVGPDAKENPIKIANRLAASDKVITSEPNIAVASKSLYTPTDTLYPEQWHLFNNGGPMLSTAAHIDAPRAWDITRGSRAVIVAVADDSCDTGHSDFQGAGKILSPRDFAGQDFAPLPELVDDNHGTACCGVAVAEETGTGVVGVAPGCALMPIRTTGTIDDASIEDICDWVIDHGAAVMSCSWSAAARAFSLTLRMRAALGRAATMGRGGKGCVLVFAAGNENRPVDGTVNETGWPNGQPIGPTRWLNGFAVHPDVIAVAASSSVATKSLYSSWGAEISVCAPSNNVRAATYPRVATTAPGRGVVTTDRVGPSGYSTTDYTRDFGGTSSACPTVAGAAALVISANPQLTAKEVREILQSTADKILDPGTDPQLGNQFGNYDANGHSPWFGHGRINAFKAVTEAVRRGQGPAGTALSKRATPALAIPDNVVAGIHSVIAFTEAATIASISVSVDITHTYIGDLRLALGTPSGTQVLLHDRNGGSADNLQRSYGAADTPGLAALAGQLVTGAWALTVQDVAAADVGTLNAWQIDMTTRAGSTVVVEEAPGMRIPDNASAGIERTLVVGQAGQVTAIQIDADITHTYIGDLVVTLMAPGGQQAVLHDRQGGSTDNLVRPYTSATVPALQALLGSAQGTWRLRVADLEAQDEGKLNRWALRLALQ
ncbi:proprotein convertase P-domain-containing protein [Variovorax sp. LjRoot84]|uniref:proprotein convertase P-domain-containing protein n=1 Tax=Variovorax sp. LjRoot84 TaxID=3342340 RepID=UPI003ECFD0BD